MILDERVLADLASSTRFRDVRLLDVTDSTNRVVAELAAGGAPEGIVVAADHQTAGRGRLDRTWDQEPGAGLLVSLLLKPRGLPLERWHLVTAAAGLAARDACATVARVDAELKWPNDLLWDGRKLAGVLAETAGDGLVVGMGLNVHAAPPGATFLDEAAGARIGRPELLTAWLRHLEPLLGDWELVSSRYRSECATVGRRVVVEQQGRIIEGTAEALDGDGRLVVRPDAAAGGGAAGSDAVPVVVSAGDVVHVRPGTGPAGGAW